MRWKGITADELTVLREIERINYQIRQTVKEFGKDSRLYQQYESILAPMNRPGLVHGMMAGHNKAGVLQLSIKKKDIKEYVLGSYKRDLQQLGKMQTVGQVKKEMVKAYETRTRQKVKTRAEIRQAVQIEKAADQKLFDILTEMLAAYYEIEKKYGGKELASHQKLRDLSKGHWTSHDELLQMMDEVDKELKAEKHKIVEDYLGGL